MTHICPRPGCPRTVPDDMFACRGDWYALPRVIRDDIWNAWRAGDADDHAWHMAEARAWYRDHPPRRAPQTPRTTRTGGETGDPQ